MFTILTHRFMTRLVLGLAVLMVTLPLATPVKADWRSLTGVLPAHAEISNLAISADSRYAVFTADIEVDRRYELYSVPITGTRPLKLNPALIVGGQVYNFEITPDSRYVIYTAKQEAGGSDGDLYRVPIAGGQASKLNLAFLSGRNIRNFKIDPDNVRVVYRAEQLIPDETELLSVQITGGGGVRLNPTLVAGGDVWEFDIDPISNRVVYRADQEVDERLDIYGVPIAGGAAVKLNPPGSHIIDFVLNPRIQVVVFRAESTSTNVYMNATAGGLLTPLNYPLASNERIVAFHVSPDGARVVYNVAVGTPTTPAPINGNLYSVLIGGGDSTLLTTSADPGYGVFYDYFYITADGQRAVYSYQKNAMATVVLESVAINGGSRANLYNQSAGENISRLDLSPNGQQVVYTINPSDQAYAIPMTGGTSVPLGVGHFRAFMPDSSRVIFNDKQPPYNLRSMSISGGEGRNLSRLDNQASAGESIISPDGRWIVFTVIYKTGRRELRVSDGAEAQPTSTVFPVYLPLIMR